MRTTLLAMLIFLLSVPARAAKTLNFYFIDVEGGQSTLVVSPSGESMLIDTGWPGERDAGRILDACHRAGVKRIDYLVVTHYHLDHVGGVPDLAARIPVGTFVDHGASVEKDADGEKLFTAYERARANGHRLLAKPGEKIPISGIQVEIVSAAGQVLSKPLPGAGTPNPACSTSPPQQADPSENAQSVGLVISYGKFRLVDLGDLTWNKELDLMCPNNKLGMTDVYLTSHHGLKISGSPALVAALHPRAAIMNNGARKGGDPEAWQTVHNSLGLEDLWQLHYAEASSPQNNAPDELIANTGKDEGHFIELLAQSSGEFTITNSRNGKTKTYKP
ncbi:MAG: MBL fold metallo-hydrolase [Acidobacteriia bacterium]|nr:MBL fold metallo-hydrolase [Terriglobia bacterium]